MMTVASAIRLAGTSELVVRLPSLLAALATAWLLFRLAGHFLDKEAGLLTVVVFTSLHEVAKDAATNARAYSIALLLLVVSVWQMMRWIETRRTRHLVGFVLSAAAIPYFHYLFFTIYFVFLVYGVYEWVIEHRVRPGELVLAAALVAILLLPLVWDFIYIHRTTSATSFAGSPDVPRLLGAVLPDALAATLFLAAIASWIAYRQKTRLLGDLPQSTKVLLGSWLIIPIIIPFVIARVTPLKVFLPRYYLPAYAALAVIIGCTLRMLVIPRMRTVFATFVVLGSLLSYSGYHPAAPPHREDWRAAARSVRTANLPPGTPVLFRVGLIETKKIYWGFDLDPSDRLLSPLAKYPVPGRVILLPYSLNDDSKRYVESVTSEILPGYDEFVLMARSEDPEFLAWLRGWFSGQGFAESQLGKPQGIWVSVFRRPGTHPLAAAHAGSLH
jgi:mannosyltransferase